MRKSFTRLFSLFALFCVLGLQMVYGGVIDRVPADDAINIKPSTDLSITFDYPLEKGDSYTGAIIELRKTSGGDLIDAITLPSSRFVIDGSKVTIDVQALLTDGTGYYVVIPNKVVKEKKPDGIYVDFAGYSATGDWNFVTGDYTAPVLATSNPFSPVDGATNVGSSLASTNVKTSTFSITFNEAVKGVSGKYIKIYTAVGNVHEMIDAGVYTSPNVAVSFTTVNLREKSDYYILVDAGAFIDNATAKNEFAGISDKTKFNFTTRDYTPAVVAADYPVKANVTNTSFDLKIKLDEPAIVYYLVLPKAAADALTTLPTAAEVVAGAQSVDATTANTEATKTIDKYWDGSALVSIPATPASADYVVYYCSKNKSKVLTTDDFLTSNVVKLGDPVSSLDDTAPTVTLLVPTAGAANVTQYLDGGTAPNHSTFSITFNESVKAGAGNIILKKSSDNSIIESVAIAGSAVSFKDASGATGTTVTDKVVVNFATKLESTTKYYVTIASGVITDKSGNKYGGIASSTVWTFTTRDVVAPTVAFSTPASKGVLGAAETVVLTFNEAIYSNATGTAMNNAAALASISVEKDNTPVTPTSVTIDGTQKIITVTVPWTQNSTYVVKLLKNKAYDASGNVIATEVKKSYNTDSYNVPSITNTSNSAINGTSISITASANIVVRFSENVELLGGGAITNDNVGSLITLNENGGGSVSFVATYDPSTRNVTINPVADLGNAKSYTLNVSTGYQDFNLIGGANQGLGATVTYTVGDTVSPAITYNFTKTNVPTLAANASIVVRFSKAIYTNGSPQVAYSGIPAQLLPFATLRLGDANGPVVPLSATVGVSGNDYTFKPAGDLAEGKTYYFSFANGVVFDNASAKNANVGASTTFVTKTTPALASSVPADGATDVANGLSQIVLNFSENVKMSTSYVAPGSGVFTAGPIVVVLRNTSTVVANSTISAANLAFVGTSLTATLIQTTAFVTEGEYEVLVDANFIYNASNNAAAALVSGDLNFKIMDFAAPVLATVSPLTATAITDASKMADPIKFTFSERVKKGIGTIAIQRVLPTVLPQEVIDVNSSTVSISTNGLIVSVNHTAFTPSSTGIVAYKVTLTDGAITDLAGNKFAGLIDDGTTVPSTVITAAAQNYTTIAIAGKQWLFSTALNTAPALDVNTSTPLDGSDKVSVSTNVVIVFNEAISLVPTTGGAKKVTIHTTTTGGVAQEYRMNESNVSISGKTITVTLTAAGLAANTQYYISLEAGAVQDIYGAPNAAIGWTSGTPDVMNGDWDFNTGDNNPPVLSVVVNGIYSSATTPNTTKVKRNSDIVLNFDEPIRLLSDAAITSADIPQSIVTLSSTGTVPSYTADISSDKKTITINASSFTASLSSVTDYTIVVSGVEDSKDHPIGTNSFTFKVDDYDAAVGAYSTNTKGLNVLDNTKGTEVKVALDYNENTTTYYQLLSATASAPSVASLKANGTAVSVDKDASPATSVVIPTTGGTVYKLYAVAYDVVNATPQAAVEVYDIQTADITAPTVVEYVNNGKLNVNPSAFVITLKFADSVAPGTGNAYVFNASDVLVETVPVGSANFTTNKQVAITIASGLVANQSYYLVVDKGFATDLAGTLPIPAVGSPTKTVNQYPGFSDKVTYTFKTLDTDGPTVSSVTPRTADAGTNVASSAEVKADVNSNIVVTFNEDILLGSNSGIGNIEILKPTTSALQELIIPSSTQVTISGKVLTINPNVDFTDGLSGYTVNIKGGTVKDAAGNDNAAASWTINVKDLAAPSVSYRANTITGDKITEKAVALADDIFVGFSEAVRLINNSAFITDDLDSLVTLVDASNVKIPFTSSTTSAFSFVINPVNPLKSDASYTLNFGQVFEDGADNAVPAQSVTFKTKLTNSPTVMFDPKNGTKDVVVGKTITITFGRSIVQVDPTQATPGYFSTLENSELKNYLLLKAGTASVAYNATINATKKVITIDPVVDFDSEAVLSLTFNPQGINANGTANGTGNAVADEIADLVDSLNNNVVVATADIKTAFGTGGGVVEFTVIDNKAPVLAGTKYSPNEAAYLNSGEKLTVQFNEKVKAGTGNIKIYRKDGTLVETIPASALTTKSDDETTVVINPTVARENNTEYYVLIPSGAIVDKSSLANVFAGTVDYTSWTYSTADNQTPMVTSLSPASGSKDVYIYDNLVIAFDKKIKIGSGNIAIYKKGGDAFDLLRVSTTEYRIKLDPSGYFVTIDFTNTLAAETEYYVEVEAGTFVNAKNTSAKFAGIMTSTGWTFSTEVTFAPKLAVNGLSPADNATLVSAEKLVLEMTFDRDVMKGTGVVKIIETVFGTLVETVDMANVVVAGNKATIPLVKQLKYGTEYHVIVEAGTVTNTLPSKVGYAGITSPTIWNFTTIGDLTAPTLVVTPPAIPVATVFTVGLKFSEPVSGVISGVTVTNGTLTSVVGLGDTYTLTISALQQKEVTIVLTDAIKDVSPNMNKFAGLTLTYTTGDFTAPTLVTWTPFDVTTTDNHPTFKMTFSEDVVLGAGGALKVYKLNTSTAVLTIPLTAAMITGKDVVVSYAATQSGLDKDTRYYVLVDGTALNDKAGNAFIGVSNVTDWTFKTGLVILTDVDPIVNNSLEFKVYPNPFDDYVNVANVSELSKIVVTNIAGQMVKEIVNPTERIQLNELRSGIYFMSLYNTEDVIVKTAKIVKR